ncbi:MAG: DUF6384 family protein [Pirellulaceae bacterium]
MNVSSEQSSSTTEAIQDRIDQRAASLSLPETLRVLEVARQMREERQTAEVALRRDEVRAQIRRKLMDSAKLTGEVVSEAEVDAAIDQYFDTMHVLKEPPIGFEWFLAHAYVLRVRILAIAVTLSIVVALLWYAFLSPWAPLSPTMRAQRAAQVQIDQSKTLLDQITAASLDDSITSDAQRLTAEVAAAGKQNPSAASQAYEKLADLWDRMQTQYEIHIVSGGNEMSAIEREFTDGQGSRLAGYYVIVEARSENGKVLRQTIRNVETGEQSLVSRWAQRVPRDVYERLKEDKLSDGVLNETLFGIKRRGMIEPEIAIVSTDEESIDLTARITSW